MCGNGVIKGVADGVATGVGVYILTPILAITQVPKITVAALIATWVVGLPIFKVAVVSGLFASGFSGHLMIKESKESTTALEKRVADFAMTISNSATGAVLGSLVGVGAPAGCCLAVGGNLFSRCITSLINEKA